MQEIGSNLKHYCDIDDSGNSQNIGLFVLADGLLEGEYQSTTYVRFLSTFNLLNSDFTPYIINVADESEFRAVKNDLLNDTFPLDIVIIERIAFDSIEFLRLLVNKCRQLGIKIIYEIDDDLLNIDKSHNFYDFYNKRSSEMDFILRNSDVVVVSTNTLKDKFFNLNNNIVVIPNVITDYWDVDVEVLEHERNNVKIGYMGTFSHNNDLKLLEEAVIQVHEYFNNKHIDFSFELIGGTPEELDWVNRILFTGRDRPYPIFVNFLKKSIDWDVAVAPLEDTAINFGKSNIKYLEYSALGVPGVYSAIGPYKEHIIHRHNGLLVKDNSPDEWAKNIITLIEDNSLREEIIKNSSQDVANNYSIDKAIELWEHVLSICKRKK